MGDASDQGLAAAVREICLVPVELDGLVFDAESVTVSEIREAQEYPGKRVKLVVTLGAMRLPLQVDVGFGDAVIPGPTEVDYPTLLDHPGPRIRAYPPETVVAEKLQAMVVLGMVNSRSKDFYDLWIMARTFTFKEDILVTAIRETFQRRGTELPLGAPPALTDEFAYDEAQTARWSAFVGRNGLPAVEGGLPKVIEELGRFLLPVLSAAASREILDSTWRPGLGWS
jgi:hypothetical protein